MAHKPTFLSSTNNALIKQLAQWQERSRARKKDGVFVVEGLREIKLALNAGYEASMFFYCPEIIESSSPQEEDFELSEINSAATRGIKTYEVSLNVYKKIAFRDSTEGAVGVFKAKDHRLEDLKLTTENPLILVAEAPEKPGNIGALLRTADAAGVDAFLLANPRTDLYNPNIIRSSVGGVFTCQIAVGSTQEIIDYLKAQNIAIYSAILQEAIPYTQPDYTKPTAVVVGTEAEGLSETWRIASEANIKIPMNGAIDSMNVSVSAGILIYEAVRQRAISVDQSAI